MNEDIILSVEHLKTDFKVGKSIVHAVNDVSFNLQRGKTLGIVGESGCGKSATAHSIIQLLPKAGNITAGSIRYAAQNGEKPLELSSLKRNSKALRMIRGRDIAMVFQDPMSSLNPVYTVGSQIAENLLKHEHISRGEARVRVIQLLKQLGIPIPEKRFDEYPHQFSGGMKQRVMIAIAMICNPNILIADEPTTALDVTIQAQILASAMMEKVNLLPDYIYRYPHEFSGGQRQRICIAKALAMNPELIVFDEPVSALDVSIQAQILNLMRALQSEYRLTYVFIAHDLSVVQYMSDRIAVMYLGKIVELASADQLYKEQCHPYSRALLSAVPVPVAGARSERILLAGDVPSPVDPPSGCRFHPRCPMCQAICREQEPALLPVRDHPDHYAACHLNQTDVHSMRQAVRLL